MNEREIASLMSSHLPSGRLNDCFEADSEVVQINGQRCLFTTDEFSEEDLFRPSEPYLVGWNIAAGAISDIYACGGTPLYYGHAVTVARHWDEKFLQQFSQGVGDVLRATNTRFMGGDCGRSDRWRCTASVIGRCDRPPLLRKGATVADAIYISGKVGAGNLEAALTLASLQPHLNRGNNPGPSLNLFALRQRESSLISDFASACIDTSDGVWSGLNNLADVSGCGYDVTNVPYLEAGAEFCSQARLPKTLLFLGGCGEYELLFTVPAARETGFQTAADRAGLTFHRLGVVTDSARTLRENESVIDLSSVRIDARDYEDPREYISKLLEFLKLGTQRETSPAHILSASRSDPTPVGDAPPLYRP